MKRSRHVARPALLSSVLTTLLAGGACSDPPAGPNPFLPAASVQVTPDTATIEIYEALTLSATVRDVHGMVLSAPTVLWQSSDTTVATVSAEGRVLATGDGTARITARSGGASGGMDIVVFDHHDGFLWTAIGHADHPFRALHLHDGQIIGATDARAFRWIGSAWEPFGLSLGRASFNTFTTWQGTLIASGMNFSEFEDGSDAWGIIRWDGARWVVFFEGLTGQVSVNAFAEYGGELIAAGSFDYRSFPGIDRIWRWDGTTWTPLGGEGPISTVYALLVHDGSLYAAGVFPQIVPPQIVPPERAATFIARWDGTQWHPLGAAFGSPFPCNRCSMAVHHIIVWQGDLIAAVQETLDDRSEVFRIARWDGASWSQLGERRYGSVSAMAVYRGELFVGTARRVERWDGTSWLPLRKPPVVVELHASPATITGLIVYEDRLVATGWFTRIGGIDASRIASWGPPQP
jgi:hypothetical protein